jgi:transcriptional regulator with XRE-family HTH domain
MVNADVRKISPAQLRAARAWLRWSQDDLSARAGVSKSSIADYESEKSLPYSGTLANLQRTIESEGIQFLFEGLVPKGI